MNERNKKRQAGPAVSGLSCAGDRSGDRSLQDSVLVIHNDVALANAYVHGVLAIAVTHSVAVTTADNFFFAEALGNADLDMHLLLLAALAAFAAFATALLAGITALAGAFTGTRIIDFNDLKIGRAHV